MADCKLAEVELSRIRTNPYQPRKYFDEDAITSLAESISEVGLMQPVIVRKSGELYELVAGERRFKACDLAGLESISAVVVDVDRSEQHITALVENIQSMGPDGPTGELLHELVSLIDRERKKRVPLVWKVMELVQSELIVETVVDLKEQFRMKEGRNE